MNLKKLKLKIPRFNFIKFINSFFSFIFINSLQVVQNLMELYCIWHLIKSPVYLYLPYFCVLLHIFFNSRFQVSFLDPLYQIPIQDYSVFGIIL